MRLVGACLHQWPRGRLFGLMTCPRCGVEATCLTCARQQGLAVAGTAWAYCAQHGPAAGSPVFGLLDVAYHCLALADALPLGAWSRVADGPQGFDTWEVQGKGVGWRIVVQEHRATDRWHILMYGDRSVPLYCAGGPRGALDLVFAQPGAWLVKVRALTVWP